MTCITIADDSMFARMLVKQVVSKLFDDIEYLECSSGQEVLGKFEGDKSIDWYLLDVNMGEPNGLETAKQLIAQGVPVDQISLITGNKSSDLQEQADEISLNYVNKAIGPNDVDEFTERLKVFFKLT